MIRISQQLVPGCLNGRGDCQVYLQSVLCRGSVCCHFPSDNPPVLTGAGSKAIPWAIRGESIICVRCLRGVHRAGEAQEGEGVAGNSLQAAVNQRSQMKRTHSPLFRAKFFKRVTPESGPRLIISASRLRLTLPNLSHRSSFTTNKHSACSHYT